MSKKCECQYHDVAAIFVNVLSQYTILAIAETIKSRGAMPSAAQVQDFIFKEIDSVTLDVVEEVGKMWRQALADTNKPLAAADSKGTVKVKMTNAVLVEERVKESKGN